MKKLITTLMFSSFILLFSSVLLSQSEENVEKYSKIKITIQDKSDLKELQQAGLSLEGMRLEENYVELILNEREIMKLDVLGYSYQILIEDMTKYYQERNKRSEAEMRELERKIDKKSQSSGFGFGSMGGFYTFDEVVAELDSMRMLYPNLITAKDSIGSTIEGRTIWAVKISDNPEIDENEPQLFYNSLVHAREPEGMMALIYFMYYLLENYSSDPEVNYLVDNREFYFVPVINPDGYGYNQQTNHNGGGMWRKNRRNTGVGLYGIDVCRNYDYMWAFNDIGSTPFNSFNDETYRGTAPFSEPETQVIRDFCLAHNFIIAHNFHSYGNSVISPWGYNLEQTSDSVVFNKIVELGTSLNNYDNFWYTKNMLYFYERNGDHLDWQYGEQITKLKILALLTEVGNDNDGFWPVPERIFPLAEENVYLNKVLAWGPGVIENPPYISEATLNIRFCRPLFDTLKISAIETNPDNHTSKVNAQLLNLNDSLVNEIELNQKDSSFYGKMYFNEPDENFYKIVLQQNGTDIPSKLIYNNLKFTTVGPIVLDSIFYSKVSTNYLVKTFVKNLSTNTTITNATIKLICDDPWVLPISPNVRPLSDIPPGVTRNNTFSFSVKYIDSLFPGYFNFKVEVMSDGWAYWVDSIRVITAIVDEVQQPLTFKLEQNYPNPFNPSTKISWQSPVSSRQTLKIYDVLGNEIATVVNEEKEAGSYEVEFKSTVGSRQLASGIYFYQLQAGSFIETKKMSLLK